MSDVPTSEFTVPRVNIPKGLATKVGYILGVVQLITAALIPIIADIPDNPEITGLIAALILGANAVVKGVNDGRQRQAAEIYRSVPSLTQSNNLFGELDSLPDEPISSALGFDPDRPVV